MKLMSIHKINLLRVGYLLLGLVFTFWIAQVNAQSFLNPQQAFQFSAKQENKNILLNLKIAKGYYLYKDRFEIKVIHGNAQLGKAIFPKSIMKYDPVFEKNVELFEGNTSIQLPVLSASGPFDIELTYQGCAEEGICYPPEKKQFSFQSSNQSKIQEKTVLPNQETSNSTLEFLSSADDSLSQSPNILKQEGIIQPASDKLSRQPEEPLVKQSASELSWTKKFENSEYLQSFLKQNNFLSILLLYFLAGILLSLLPCSYPMLPILTAIIVGEGAGISRRRSFMLSLVYVLGMAFVYALLGILAALLGFSLGGWLQNPIMLGFFALLLVIFAGVLISGKDIQLPKRWQQHTNEMSQRTKGGKYWAVALMGALSALVVGACMTAPLFAMLTFIAHTGSLFLGAFALFFMALGLGVPLLIIGLGASAILPKAGNWMSSVKVIFGALLLGAALWIIWPVLSAEMKMVFVGIWLVFVAFILIDAISVKAILVRVILRTISVILFLWAILVFIGLAAGGHHPFRPLQGVFSFASQAPSQTIEAPALTFRSVKSIAELNQVLKESDRPIFVDFYANWCVVCHEMEKFTFSDQQVKAALQGWNLVRVDVTKNDADDQALLKAYQLFGPPAMILFNQKGQERQRLVGYLDAKSLLGHLKQID